MLLIGWGQIRQLAAQRLGVVGSERIQVADAGGRAWLDRDLVAQLGIDMSAKLGRGGLPGRLIGDPDGDLGQVGGVVAQLDTAADQVRVDLVEVAC